MIPYMCQTKHDPENGTYGDCFRACVASILEIEPDDVPHFCELGEPVTNNDRLTEWLSAQGLASFFVVLDGSASRDDLLEHVGTMNPDAYYMLFGQNSEGDHVVVCKGSRVVHNPAWIPQPITRPSSNGFWGVMVLARR